MAEITGMFRAPCQGRLFSTERIVRHSCEQGLDANSNKKEEGGHTPFVGTGLN